jgi:hypothetical protein
LTLTCYKSSSTEKPDDILVVSHRYFKIICANRWLNPGHWREGDISRAKLRLRKKPRPHANLARALRFGFFADSTGVMSGCIEPDASKRTADPTLPGSIMPLPLHCARTSIRLRQRSRHVLEANRVQASHRSKSGPRVDLTARAFQFEALLDTARNRAPAHPASNKI